MLQLKFFFLGVLIAGLKGVESFPPIEGKPGETFRAGLSPARVDENYYDNQARAMPVEEDDNEMRALQFVEPEARLSFDQARLMDESYRRRQRNIDHTKEDCFDRKFYQCLDTISNTVAKCATVARRGCNRI